MSEASLNRTGNLRLYNNLSQRLEPFSTRDDAVTIYVCGVTPYDTTHLGHAFTYVSYDLLIRHLESKGLTVRYVQNVTDIDDDVLQKARQVGEDWRALGDRWTAHFIRDMQSLNVRPPDYYPRATEFIPQMLMIIQGLIDRGFAYASGGSVFFHIDACPTYGKLSRMPRQEMLVTANERGNRADDPRKRDPLDFVLWQAEAPDEPAWGSPWGPGRPGWHIECSTMATILLGNTIDIHGGGADLLFPHHESEIAQSECATGENPFVRFWLHTAMVRYQGEKMSKSLGNLILVRDLLESWSPDAIRLYLLSHHYHDAWSHDDDELARARESANKLLAAVQAVGGPGAQFDPEGAWANFTSALGDDLDSPTAITTAERLAEQALAAADNGNDVSGAQAVLRRMGQVLGLRLDSPTPERRVMSGWDEHLRRFVPGER